MAKTGLAITDTMSLVLIVDDEPLVRNALRRTLQPHGYSVVEACDGPSGLAIIGDRADLRAVILDIEMPGMTGLEVLAQIRASRPALPVLLSSSCVDTPVHLADGFLAKPYSARQLLDALENLCVRAP